MTHDSTELCNKSINVRVPPRPPWQCWIYLCVTVSLTILPGCQLVKYIVAVMKLFAYNDNTDKISAPWAPLLILLPLLTFNLMSSAEAEMSSNNCCNVWFWLITIWFLPSQY